MKKLILTLTIFISFCPGIQAKDIVELKSGKKIECTVVSENRTEIEVHTGETRLFLPKSMIRIIKKETALVSLSDGRELAGRIEKETDSSISLRMKLGGVEIDRMDIDKIERKIVEEKPAIWDKKNIKSICKSRKPVLRAVRLPVRTEHRSRMELQWLRMEAEKYARNKQYEKAVAKYKKILRSAPKSRIIYYRISCLYALSGDKNNAVKYLRMAVAAGFADFKQIERNRDFDSIRNHKGYMEVMSKRDALQYEAAESRLEELKKQFGEGYTYQVDKERKLIFATNQSMEMLERMKEHLTLFADAQMRLLWDHRPSYYITVICPDKETFRREVPNPGIAGLYFPGKKMIISNNISSTLDHEFTHALHDADESIKGIKSPNYISEGFATIFESCGMIGENLVPRKITSRFHCVRNAVGSGSHVPWERITCASHCQFMQKNCHLNYCQSRYMMFYLYEKGRLKRWYNNYCQTCHLDESGKIAWEKTYCMTFEEIEKEWTAWIKSMKSRYRKLARWDGPYLGAEFEECGDDVVFYKIKLASPAFKAGLRDGDIIVSADDTRIKKYNDIIDFLDSKNPGDDIELTIIRAGRELKFKVALGNQPKEG